MHLQGQDKAPSQQLQHATFLPVMQSLLNTACKESSVFHSPHCSNDTMAASRHRWQQKVRRRQSRESNKHKVMDTYGHTANQNTSGSTSAAAGADATPTALCPWATDDCTAVCRLEQNMLAQYLLPILTHSLSLLKLSCPPTHQEADPGEEPQHRYLGCFTNQAEQLLDAWCGRGLASLSRQ